MRDVARLRRSSTDRYVGGISGGLGRHFDVDPVLFRVLFVVTAILGVGLFAYLALWLVVPEEGRERGILSLDDRGRAVAVTVIAIAAGLLLVAGGVNGPDAGIIGPALLVGLVVWLLSRRRDLSAAVAPGPVPSYAPGTEGMPGDPPASVTDTTTATVAEAPIYAAAPGWAGEAQMSEARMGQTPPAQIPPTQTPPRLLPGYVPKPPNPKKRGPVLFGFALAAIVLGLGILGMVDTAGADVSAAAYPALALAISGCMLVLGAFFGRAGGIILLGLLSVLGLGVSTAAEHITDETLTAAPTSSAQVEDSYYLEAGEVRIDLSQVSDPAALAGRTIEVSAEVGDLHVILPHGVTVESHSTIEGFGSTRILNQFSEGVDIDRTDYLEPAGSQDNAQSDKNQPLTLITSIGVGTIEVTR